uniref:Cytoplasmic dynein 2 light intermediate chain 1 n=1 Tax=Denticeps clupeoides TaxID=299321 RepID=A0AAY4CQ31_9TELE
MPKTSDTLWELAAEEVRKAEDEEEQSLHQRTVFFLGSKGGGKTTILLRCLDRDEPPKATLALEYTFGRRARGHNTLKDIAHLWELGGGDSLSDLVQIPVTPQSFSVVLVLDLSKPNFLWATATKLLQIVRMLMDKACSSSQRTGIPLTFRKDHPDRELTDPLPVPLLIIGSKYDLFQDFESERRKIICKTLRFLAHYYGGSLIFTSNRSDTMMSKTRMFVNHLAFGTEGGKSLCTDPSKPLMVPAGMDSLSLIGSPSTMDVDIGTLHARMKIKPYGHRFNRISTIVETIFHPSSILYLHEHKELKDPAKDPQYSELVIDSMRAQKDQELNQYKRNMSKSWRDLDLES